MCLCVCVYACTVDWEYRVLRGSYVPKVHFNICKSYGSLESLYNGLIGLRDVSGNSVCAHVWVCVCVWYKRDSGRGLDMRQWSACTLQLQPLTLSTYTHTHTSRPCGLTHFAYDCLLWQSHAVPLNAKNSTAVILQLCFLTCVAQWTLRGTCGFLNLCKPVTLFWPVTGRPGGSDCSCVSTAHHYELLTSKCWLVDMVGLFSLNNVTEDIIKLLGNVFLPQLLLSHVRSRQLLGCKIMTCQ